MRSVWRDDMPTTIVMLRTACLPRARFWNTKGFCHADCNLRPQFDMVAFLQSPHLVYLSVSLSRFVILCTSGNHNCWY